MIAEGVPPERRQLNCCASPAEDRSGTTREGFHGTTASAAKSILASGFNRSSGGMLGPGVYWSDDIQKTSGYGDGTVLQLSIRCGKTKRIDGQGHELQKTWHSKGYDTAWVPKGCGMVGSGLSESCTYDPSRIQVIGISKDGGSSWEPTQGYASCCMKAELCNTRVAAASCAATIVAMIVVILATTSGGPTTCDDFQCPAETGLVLSPGDVVCAADLCEPAECCSVALAGVAALEAKPAPIVCRNGGNYTNLEGVPGCDCRGCWGGEICDEDECAVGEFCADPAGTCDASEAWWRAWWQTHPVTVLLGWPTGWHDDVIGPWLGHIAWFGVSSCSPGDRWEDTTECTSDSNNRSLTMSTTTEGTQVPSSWSRTSNRYCDGNMGRYDTVGAAIAACRADASCRYISDSGCNNQGIWETCRDSGSASTAGSCMYRKGGRLTFSVSVGPCAAVSDGACFRSPNYPSMYGDNERCTIAVHGSGTVSSSTTETQGSVFLTTKPPSYDELTIAGKDFSGDGGDLSSGGVAVSDGENISWDGSYTDGSFEVCSCIGEGESKFRCIEGPTDVAAFLFWGVLYHTAGPCFGQADALAANDQEAVCAIYFVGWVVYFVFMLACQCVLWLAMCAVLLCSFGFWLVVLAIILFFYVVMALIWLLELIVMTVIGLLGYLLYGMAWWGVVLVFLTIGVCIGCLQLSGVLG
jgi:hypothetical protein